LKNQDRTSTNCKQTYSTYLHRFYPGKSGGRKPQENQVAEVHLEYGCLTRNKEKRIHIQCFLHQRQWREAADRCSENAATDT